MLKWALAVVPAGDGLPVSLYVAMPGARDLPALRRLAAADGVAPAAALPAALAGLRVVALAGLRAMRASSEDAVRGAVAEVADGDELLAPLMARTSAAEGELLSAAASAAADAADVVLRSFAAGARCSDALLDGDLAARLAGMHDVRVLWSPDGGRTLRPLEGRSSRRGPSRSGVPTSPSRPAATGARPCARAGRAHRLPARALRRSRAWASRSSRAPSPAVARRPLDARARRRRRMESRNVEAP